jgi:hypothetical protein
MGCTGPTGQRRPGDGVDQVQWYNLLQRGTARCNRVQHVATCCNADQVMAVIKHELIALNRQGTEFVSHLM